MPGTKIREYLTKEGIPYTTILHPPAFTAQKLAAAAHVPGREVAKTVVIKLDGKLSMAILPADLNLDLDHVRTATGATIVELATEWEFKDRFPDCEAGAMPPFGNLYNMPVYVADTLAEDEFISFNAGNHREMIRMAYADFARLVQPRVLDITWHRV